MLLRLIRKLVALLGAALLLAACGDVQIVSPYNQEIANRAAKLHDEVFAFELAMRQESGTPSGDPRLKENRRRFNEWQASVGTMIEISSKADPRVLKCQTVFSRVARVAGQGSDPVAQTAREQEGDAGLRETDCQTYGIIRLGQRLEQMRRLYESQCRVPSLADSAFTDDQPRAASGARVRLPGCEALWTPLAAGAALGLAGQHGLAADAVLRSIAAVMAVQEEKRKAS